MAFSVGLVLEKYWFSIVYIAVCIELELVAAFSTKILIEKVLKQKCFFWLLAGSWFWWPVFSIKIPIKKALKN